jgi:hypothetical protein
VLDQSFDQISAQQMKQNLNNVSLKLGFDVNDRANSITGPAPCQQQVKEDLLKNRAVYKDN